MVNQNIHLDNYDCCFTIKASVGKRFFNTGALVRR
jgi:hypothetical protein